MSGLKQQVAKSSLNMATANLASRLIGTVALVFLARLLEPADFGLVALSMVIFSTSRLFSDLGMASALIHSKQDGKQVAFQGFVITACISLILFAAININPYAVAQFLGSDTLVPILQSLSWLILIEAWALVPEAILRKEMAFGVVSRVMMISNLLDNVAAISLALLGFGVWSLVYSKLIGELVQLILFWWLCPGWDWLIPKQWQWQLMREMFDYGIKSASSGLLNFLNSNGDDWLVGRLLGPTPLGFYNRAYSLTNGAIVGLNQSVVSAVLFPSYAKIQHDLHRLSKAYIKGLGLSALIMAPLAMGVFAVADELVPLVMGAKWVSMIPTLQIFAFMALARPMAATTSPLFRALGRPDFDLRAGLVVTATMVPLIFVLLDRGIEGVALAVTVSFVCGFLFNIYQVHKLLPGTAAKMLPAILPAVIASAAMIAGVSFARMFILSTLGNDQSMVFAALLVIIGGIIYVGTAFLLHRTLIEEIVTLFLSMLRRKRPSVASSL